MLVAPYLDSHTEGEPTRILLGGFPELRGETLREKSLWFQANCSGLRKGILLEPRGFPAIVGCLLLPPETSDAVASLIFFNNRGVLRMCGHGTIGAAVSMHFLERTTSKEMTFNTPEGNVKATLQEDGRTVEIENVISSCWQKDVKVPLPNGEVAIGDISYGGNWFFLTSSCPHSVEPKNLSELTNWSTTVQQAIWEQGITGKDGAEIDHIEVFGPPSLPDADSRNFVLCPGAEYDRSPCGTGTSAKLATLAAKGELKPGQIWAQESIIGSLFRGRYEEAEGGVRPFVSGAAYITGQGEFLFDPTDPFREGLPLGDAS